MCSCPLCTLYVYLLIVFGTITSTIYGSGSYFGQDKPLIVANESCRQLMCSRPNIYLPAVKDMSKAVFKRVPYYSLLDGFPYLYINPETKQKAIICFCEKVGSTSWKALLYKSFNESQFQSMNILKFDPHAAQYKNRFTPKTTKEIFEAAVKNKSIPRIMLVRNPYSRLLSGFLDKVNVTNAVQRRLFFKGFKDKSGAYASFVKYVRGVHERDIEPTNRKAPFLNDHYMLQSDKCFIPGGMRYDYILKVEHTAIWYPFLINLLGLQKVASSGWNFTNAWRRSKPTMKGSANISNAINSNKTFDIRTSVATIVTKTIIRTSITTKSDSSAPATSTTSVSSTTTEFIGNNNSSIDDAISDDFEDSSPPCFYSPPGLTCHDLHRANGTFSYETPCDTNYLVAKGTYNLTVAALMDESTFIGRSIAAMRAYYTPEIAADVTSFAQKDLDTFGYAAWDGNDVVKYAQDNIVNRLAANCSVMGQFDLW